MRTFISLNGSFRAKNGVGAGHAHRSGRQRPTTKLS
jgi:hypothetical protein